MQLEEMLLPTIATIALGTALLMPLRDARPGRRATVSGLIGPLLSRFVALEDSAPAGETCVPDPHHPQPVGRARHDVRSALKTMAGRVHEFFMTPVPSDVDAAPTSEDIVERSFADALGSLLSIAQPEAEAEPGPESDFGCEAELEPESDTVKIPIARVSTEVATIVPSFDRIVPLTRMPLRPQAREITWPRDMDVPRAFESETERLTFLANAIGSAGPDVSRTLISAYQQESTPGRILALRALRTSNDENVEDVYIDAIHVGTDEERALAVDVLIARGRTDELAGVLHDRIDAIAAVAALGYVGSRRRDQYFEKLAPHIDRARIENILILLAGIVE